MHRCNCRRLMSFRYERKQILIVTRSKRVTVAVETPKEDYRASTELVPAVFRKHKTLPHGYHYAHRKSSLVWNLKWNILLRFWRVALRYRENLHVYILTTKLVGGGSPQTGVDTTSHGQRFVPQIRNRLFVTKTRTAFDHLPPYTWGRLSPKGRHLIKNHIDQMHTICLGAKQWLAN